MKGSMPGRLAPESVAGINRKEWPEWIGMGGRLASESVADFKRNMQGLQIGPVIKQGRR